MARLTDRWHHPSETAYIAHGTGGRVGPGVGLDAIEKWGNFCLFRQINRESSDAHPVAHSLSCLSYLDSAFMVVLLLNGIKHMTEEVCSAVMLHIPKVFWGSFAKLRKKRLLASSCLSVRPFVITGLPVN